MRAITDLRSLVLAPLVAALVVTSYDVLAQDVPILEEIIVTASKRETTLQDTPIAITALTGDTLEAFNIQKSVARPED